MKHIHIFLFLPCFATFGVADEITGLNLRAGGNSQPVNPTAVAGAVLSLDSNKRPTFGGNMKIETIAGAGNFSSAVPQWTFGTDYAFRKTNGFGFAVTNAAGNALGQLCLSSLNLYNGDASGFSASYLYVKDSVYAVDDSFSDPGVHLSSVSTIDFSSGAATHTKGDTIISRESAATLQLGADHATTPTAQTFKAHDVTTGTGAPLWLTGGKGSVAGGSAIIGTSATNGAPTAKIEAMASGSIAVGVQAALNTTATDGFIYVPTCAGPPTGVPTAITGLAPIVIDTTNNKLYFYSSGAWRDAGP